MSLHEALLQDSRTPGSEAIVYLSSAPNQRFRGPTFGRLDRRCRRKCRWEDCLALSGFLAVRARGRARGSCYCYPVYFCRQRLLRPIVDVGERYFDTAGVVRRTDFLPGRALHGESHRFSSRTVAGGAANSPDFPTELALAPHFIVPAR